MLSEGMNKFRPLLNTIAVGFLAANFLALQDVSAFTQGASAQSASANPSRILTIGRVSGNPRKHAGRLLALGQFIVARHEGFDNVEVVLKPHPDEMVAAALRGEIDLISETVFTALQLEKTGKMEMALLEWKDGVRAYHSQILVRADSDVRSLQDLRGKRIAFEDPGSTSGFFLPYVEIMNAGVDMIPEAAGKTVPGKVSYSFGGAEINVVGALIRGRVDAAVISNLDMHDDEVVPDKFVSAIRVLHATREVPRSMMLMRASIKPADRTQLEKLLLSLHETDPGRAILRRYFKVRKFDPIDRDAQMKIDSVRRFFHERHSR